MNKCCRCKTPIEPGEDWYGLHQNCFTNWFGVDRLSHFLDIIPRSQSLPPWELQGKNASFFHGAFRKYSSKLGDNDYILKVIQEDHPELPATEFLCNQLYESLGVQIPNYHLVRYPGHHFCFVTRNFMSKLPNSSLVHIHHYLNDKRQHTCEQLVTIIGEKTGRRTEQERFVYLTLVDSLIGNHDRHGRNLGFIQSPKGMHLAPFYDNPSYVGLDDGSMLDADLQPRGAIFTKETEEPKMSDYVLEWKRLGYLNVVEEFRKALSLEELKHIIQESFITQKRQNALFRLICKRSEEL